MWLLLLTIAAAVASETQDRAHQQEHDHADHQETATCYSPLAMYLDGFHNSMDCLVWLHRSLPMNHTLVFMVASMLLALALEYLALQAPSSSTLHYVSTAVLGYLLMLLAMTYSSFVMASVIVGLMLGYWLWSPAIWLVDEEEEARTTPCCKEDDQMAMDETDPLLRKRH